ncbi:MAG TPA: CPBP family intramembrane glutamic endopeptidase [Chloroflexota bacterium]|nr:CPBP family intramembrane glutamic endopeptidase [Chloroflexota bacterium]
MSTSTASVAPPPPHQRARVVRAIAVAAGLALLVGLVLAHQVGAFLEAALSLGQLPLLALALLSWQAPRSRFARVGALLLLYAAGEALVTIVLALVALYLVGPENWHWPLPAETVLRVKPVLQPLIWVLLGLLAAPLLLLIRPVRTWLARYHAVEPDNFRHWLGFVALFWFTFIPLTPLPVLDGRAPFEVVTQLQPVLQRQAERGPVLSLWYEFIYSVGWTVLLCLVAVGFPVWVKLPHALARLGLTWPGWRALGVGILISLMMVPVFIGVDHLAAAAVEALGLQPTSNAWIEQLFGHSFGVGGALAAAVSAGVGEELIWRGVIQPRYGLVPATVGFAAMHAFQYGPEGLISVLLAGLVLGVVRWRFNTTVSAVTHTGYDLWLLLLMLAGFS